MPNNDENPDDDADEQCSTSTRRSFLSIAAIGGSTAVLGRVFGRNDGGQQTEFGGDTAGRVGRRHAEGLEIGQETSTPTATDAETPEQTSDQTDTPDETPDGEEPPDEPGFRNATVEEHRGDVARFTAWTGGADEVELVIGSEDVNFEISLTAVDGNDDGQVTVAVDTFVVGRSEVAGVSAPDSGDEIRDYQLETQLLSSLLDPAAYPLELYVDGELVDLGVLVLEPRETRAARSGVAPRTVDPGNRREFVDTVAVRDEVATDDWAVAEFDVTGIYAAFDGGDAFEDEALGYELTVEQTDVVNAVPETVPLENIEFVAVEKEDRFYAVVDSGDLEVDESYEATFALTDVNPYVADGEREEVSTRFTVVERTASFDADEPLEVPSDEATVSGTTTVAPGSTVTVSVRGTGERGFQKTAEATVEADGSWSATLDFSDVEAGTAFTAEVNDLSGVVEGEVT